MCTSVKDPGTIHIFKDALKSEFMSSITRTFYTVAWGSANLCLHMAGILRTGVAVHCFSGLKVIAVSNIFSLTTQFSFKSYVKKFIFNIRTLCFTPESWLLLFFWLEPHRMRPVNEYKDDYKINGTILFWGVESINHMDQKEKKYKNN